MTETSTLEAANEIAEESKTAEAEADAAAETEPCTTPCTTEAGEADEPEGRILVRKIYRGSVRISSFYRSQITKELESLSKQLELPGTVKFSHYDVLCELYHNADKASTPTELAEATETALPNVSKALSELVELGLVECVGDPNDRRRTVVHTTDLGMRFGDAIAEQWTAMAEIFDKSIDMEVLVDQYDKFEEAIKKL